MTSYKEIAEIAKVSPTTVSHVINKTRFVAPETQERVHEAMEKLNYTQPNLLARSLLTGKSNTLGLVISDIRNPFYPELIQGVEEVCQKEGYNLFLCNTNYNSEAAINSIKTLIGHRVAGIIIAASQMDDLMVDKVLSLSSNMVFIGDSISNDKTIKRDIIRFNFSTGFEDLVAHLVELGHREYIFVKGPKGIHTFDVRFRCFVNALEKYRKKDIHYIIKEGAWKIGGGQKVGKELLKEGKAGTAIICSNDITAISIMNVLSTNGVKIPDEISITGLDNIRLSEISNPPLTTIDLKRHKTGRMAAEIMLKRVKDKDLPAISKIIKTKFIARSSTGKAYKK